MGSSAITRPLEVNDSPTTRPLEMDNSATTRQSLEAYACERLGFAVDMANAHDSRVISQDEEGYNFVQRPSTEFLNGGITFVNLTDETLGIGCIPLLIRGDSARRQFAQAGASEAENITRAVAEGKGTFEWVGSRSESTVRKSATEACWVLLVCRQRSDNVVEVLDVHHTGYLKAWQLAVLQGMLAADRPPVARVVLHDNQVGHAAAVMFALVEALAQTHPNTILRGVVAIPPILASLRLKVIMRGVEYTHDVNPGSCTVGNVLSLLGADKGGALYSEEGALDINSIISDLKTSETLEDNRLCIRMNYLCPGPKDNGFLCIRMNYFCPDPKDKGFLTFPVHTLTNETYTIEDLLNSDTVYDMKMKIRDKKGTPLDQQRLVGNGRTMEDWNPIGSLGLSQDAGIHLVLRLRGGAGAYFFRCRQALGPLPLETNKMNVSFHKRTRSDLKRSQIHVVNYSGVSVTLYLFSTWAPHLTNVAYGTGINLAGVGGVEANRSQTVVADRCMMYGGTQRMFLLAGADQVYDVPMGFKPEAFVVGGTMHADTIELRNGCQQNVPGKTQLDVMPGFLQSPALAPCTLDQASANFAERFAAGNPTLATRLAADNPMRPLRQTCSIS